MQLLIGKGSCGLAAGAEKISEILRDTLAGLAPEVPLAPTGCLGLCFLEPIVEALGSRPATFVRVDEPGAVEIARYAAGLPNQAQAYLLPEEDAAVLAGQTRIALRNCGRINPEDIDAYMAAGGYAAFTGLAARTPEVVIEELKLSGLAGRGGAGFPTWFKWRAAREAPGSPKYMLCNADEGDPGAFMDRAVLEGDPHAVIEGMLIGAYAVGASEGAVYVRAEYPLAIRRLETALAQAQARGFLGENILGDFSFRLRISAGAGAFVCGEETALIASLEGERGMPRLKPPFPAQQGLWKRPTNINNVETYANVPWILRHGGAAFAALGTEGSKGTKVFALTGKIKKGGLAEIPMGSTLRHIIYHIGGGLKGDRPFKAVQMGGPSGGCIPAPLLDTPIDYNALAATGAIMGSGGMVVMDDQTCMVDMARFFMAFTCKESCGKCTHCRVGTKRMLEILERITQGRGQEEDIETLRALALHVKEGALCGLGQTAPNPVLTTLRYFEEEYRDHILHKKCAAKHCRALLTYTIAPEKCRGCTLCARVCPAQAITGGAKAPHTLDPERCLKCGQCLAACRFDAVTVA
jgi:NADH-quinone oxidoreductase subunit F